jgi:hypothetical protein
MALQVKGCMLAHFISRRYKTHTVLSALQHIFDIYHMLNF